MAEARIAVRGMEDHPGDGDTSLVEGTAFV